MGHSKSLDKRIWIMIEAELGHLESKQIKGEQLSSEELQCLERLTKIGVNLEKLTPQAEHKTKRMGIQDLLSIVQKEEKE